MKKLWVVLFLIVGVAVGVFLLLPPATETLTASTAIDEPVRGTIHVHTRRSDGSGTMEDVATAAASAGLKFVIFSDHGDATRAPQPPGYTHGVLCIDAIEIPTSAGHVVALGLTEPTPYRLGGDPRDVIDDIARLGGVSVAAHPTSAKPGLRWRDWDVPFDSVEWLNADSEWRDERTATLVRALLTYPWRRPETMAALLDRPDAVLKHWDELLQTRRVVAIAGADAHASIGLNGESNPYGDGSLIALPAYEQSFRTFSVSLPAVRLTGDAYADARAVLREIREGRLYSSIDGLARPARLSFTARSGAHQAQGGEVLTLDGPVTIDVSANAPAGARIDLVRDGEVATSATGGTLHFEGPADAAVYRVEIYLRGGARSSEVPWLLSNPIYAGMRSRPSPASFKATNELVRNTDGSPASGWAVEKTEKALGVLDVVKLVKGSRIVLRYGLGGGEADSPYVALTMPAGPDLAKFDRITFEARSDSPSRIWVQLWMPASGGNKYWRRSVFLDSTPRYVSIPFAEMLPPDPTGEKPPLQEIRSIKFVVDGVHTAIGTNGRFWIDDLKYQR